MIKEIIGVAAVAAVAGLAGYALAKKEDEDMCEECDCCDDCSFLNDDECDYDCEDCDHLGDCYEKYNPHKEKEDNKSDNINKKFFMSGIELADANEAVNPNTTNTDADE